MFFISYAATSDVQQQSNGTNEIDSNPPIPSSAVIPNSPGNFTKKVIYLFCNNYGHYLLTNIVF